MEKFKIEFKYASIFTAICLIWVYIEKYLGLHSDKIEYHSLVGLVMLIPLVICIVIAINTKKKEYYKGNITLQKAFMSGALLSLLIAGLSAGPLYVMSYYISPDFFDLAVQKSVERGLSEDNSRMLFNLNAYVKNSMMFYLSFGIMISAVVALIFKKKKKVQ